MPNSSPKIGEVARSDGGVCHSDLFRPFSYSFSLTTENSEMSDGIRTLAPRKAAKTQRITGRHPLTGIGRQERQNFIILKR